LIDENGHLIEQDSIEGFDHNNLDEQIVAPKMLTLEDI
tara:strand:+ start:383 stop:496 length:114 start_codon:yes stop_codon:yes gene_type:complete